MIEAGILNGDYVVAEQRNTVNNGDIAVVGIPGGEATIKFFKLDGPAVTLTPANPTMEPMVFGTDDVSIYGRVVTVMRKL
jgi:repressor LexA